MHEPRDKLRYLRINFAEQFFPARTNKLLQQARELAQKEFPLPRGRAIATNRSYVRWLQNESMLHEAHRLARKYSGQSHMWLNPFARPRPRFAIKQASVWYTAYPISLITREGESILSSLADPLLWDTFQDIGIQGLHTGPMKRAGGTKGWSLTPSIDGHFDRISTKIDHLFGTEKEFRAMVEVAAEHDAIIIDDIVPGHTGKGPDFRLAEMNHLDYPGIYHMIEIKRNDWDLLPTVPHNQDSVNLNHETEEALKNRGYIVGKLPRVIFYEPGIKETNWSVTREVIGTDGIKRRWVYLHYFKDGQPSLNWLDPSFAGMKLVIGDALHSLGELGAKGLRLDANGFLGIEVGTADQPAWSEGHPLSEAANHLIASMVRKLGGFTFQELNLSIDDIKAMSSGGADLSYDFVNRPAYHHALVTGDTEFLRMTLRTALDLGIDPASLVHAMQNHDELTFELVHFWSVHKDDYYMFRGKKITGAKLRSLIRQDLKKVLVGSHAPYNLPFTENGIACTNVSAIAAHLGFKGIHALTEVQKEQIKQVHLLLVKFNAWQPGVFALSGWDLCGSFTLDKSEVANLVSDGDTRWVNRGSYDLLGTNPLAQQSAAGMPKAYSLYGTVAEQMCDPNSFARQLKDILAMREACGLPVSHQLDILEVEQPEILAMIHRLPDDSIQITALNFSGYDVQTIIAYVHLPNDATVTNMMDGEKMGKVISHSFDLKLPAYSGLSLGFRQTAKTKS